jgi:hypothetical protein
LADKLIIDFDPEDLEIDEADVLEQLTGKTLSEIAKALVSQNVSAKIVKGLIWLAGRRRDPEFTLEDAGKVKFGDWDWAEATVESGNGNGSSPKKD